jgi:hypothetical protein
MLGYYTDNSVSQGVMRAFALSGVQTSHINNFSKNKDVNSIFYGILRGSGIAMRYQKMMGVDFWYVDNGYFEAEYRDKDGFKEMTGKYRVVKNQMIEPINVQPFTRSVGPMNILVMPPTPYTAFMNDMIPEDWIIYWRSVSKKLGHTLVIREKEAGSHSLDEQLEWCDAVLAFNSMGVMKAIEMGKGVYTTHGIVRNSELFDSVVPYYKYEEIRKFYEPKQFTLEEIKDRGVACLN